MITVNKKLRDTLRLREGSRLQVALQKDESEFGLPVPEEFSASLEADPAGADWFYALTPGKQRTLLYIAQSVKNSDLRMSESQATNINPGTETQARPLGLWMATALVVGSMIGSGVFLLPAALAPYGAASLIGWGIALTGAKSSSPRSKQRSTIACARS